MGGVVKEPLNSFFVVKHARAVRYDEKHTLRSHEVTRFRYSTILNDMVGVFDIHHFILSSDVLRLITFPESLNGETGPICSYLGGPKE